MARGPTILRLAAVMAAVLSVPASAQVDPLAPLPTQAIQQRPSWVPQQTRALTGYAAYKLRLADLARRAGVREATIRNIVPWLPLNRRAIELDRAQPGGVRNPNAAPPFAPYRRRHVTADLISRGASRYAANRRYLLAIEARSGVQASVLLAIFGHETSYGRVTGGFDLLEALASLAYEGRRRAFFEEEFVAALQLIDRGIVSRARLKGSWAGATGYPQFMPSAVIRLRTDGDGDGRADIWSNQNDALASIATYLRDAGWKPHVRWGIPVRVPTNFNRAAVRTSLNAPRCAPVYKRHSRWLTMREWRAMGVVPYGRAFSDGEMATLLEPDGRNAAAYLLSNNYRAILDYNCSNFYALSVGLLADAIVGR